MKGICFSIVIGALLLSLTAAVGVWAAAADWGAVVIPAGKPIKIGLGSMLTGSYANMGIDIKNGAELALADAGGELLGHKLELAAEDDQCEGAPAVNLAHKFCNDPLIAGVVGYMCSGGTVPASEVHNRYKLPLISPSSTAINVTNRGIPVLFRTCWNDRIQGLAAAQFALKRNYKRAAIVHDKSIYGEGLGTEFKKNFEAGGGKITGVEGLTRGEQDFRAVLTKLKLGKPDLVYFGGMATEGVLVVRQMRQLKFSAKFIGPDGCYSEKDFIAGGGAAAQGAYVTYARATEGPAYQDWLKRFETRYGPRSTFSPQAYDAASILLEVIGKTAQKKSDGSLVISKKALADALRKEKYSGVTGSFSFDATGDRTGSDVGIFEVQGKKFVELK